MRDHYAIIGGGIAGASIAYHLSEITDKTITLFERQSPASETTYKSVAQFGFYGDETQYRMKQYGMRLYNRFFREPRANPRFHSMGILLAATDANNAALFEKSRKGVEIESIGMIGEDRGRDMVKYIPGETLDEQFLLPPVDTEAIAGALFRPRVGYMSRPQELAYEFLERAEENGVTVRSGTEVAEITTKNNRVTGVVTGDDNEVDATEVVCAAGPWNIEVAESVGIDIPVQHTIAPVVSLKPKDPIEYDLPSINHFESPYAFHRRSEEELLIGYNPGYEDGTRYDPRTVGERVPEAIRNEGFDLLAELVPGWRDAGIADEWVGIRSITPDGNPIVGWTELKGFNIAAFHTSGIQLSPAVGRMIAKQIVEDDPTDYYDALSITRFDEYEDWRS